MSVNNMSCENATPKTQNLVFLMKARRFVRMKKHECEELKSYIIYKNVKADIKYLKGKIEAYEEVIEFLDLFSFSDKIRRKK